MRSSINYVYCRLHSSYKFHRYYLAIFWKITTISFFFFVKCTAIKLVTVIILMLWYTNCRILQVVFIKAFNQNICTFIAVCFEEISVSALRRRLDNKAETCSNYVKDLMHRLQKSTFVDEIRLVYFIIMKEQTMQIWHTALFVEGKFTPVKKIKGMQREWRFSSTHS